MKKTILLFVICSPFFSCNQNEAQSLSNQELTSEGGSIYLAKLKDEISKLESRLLKAQDAKKDKEAAKELIAKTQNLVKEFPKDSSAAELLFKAGDVSRGLGEYRKAIELWGTVSRDYPTYNNAAHALFLQGFTFDADLEDKENAIKYYQQFLKEYPKHSLSQQVIMLLSVIEKSSTELVKEYEKNKNR